MNSMTKLLDFLTQLKEHTIHYTLEHNREEAMMVLIATPGERWEVEFFADNHVEVEVFRSPGMSGEEEMKRLFREDCD